MNNICVYCGSGFGNKDEYLIAAKGLGKELAKRGIGLVYGGSSTGLMGTVADSVLEAGGVVTGIIPKAIFEKELAHEGLTKLVVVDSMHQRKAAMAEAADGFIALPGGFGTFEELFEILTWAQLDFHQKPTGILNICGYYDNLKQQIEKSITEGFVQEVHRQLVIIEDSSEEILNRFDTYKAPPPVKWLSLLSQPHKRDI